MTEKQFNRLRVGDIVRRASSLDEYIVSDVDPLHVTAVRTVELVNHTEWELLKKSEYHPPEVEEGGS